MKIRQMVVQVLAGMVLVAPWTGGEQLLQAGEGRRWVRPQGNYRAGGFNFGDEQGEDSPEMQEMRVWQAQIETVVARQHAIRNEVLKSDETVKAALQQATDALSAYNKALEENPEYKAAQQELEALGDRDQVDRENMREWWKMRYELQKKLQSIPNEVPELKELANKRREAALAFDEVIEKVLAQNPEYVELTEQAEQYSAAIQQCGQDMMNAARQRAEEMRQAHRQQQNKEEQPGTVPQKKDEGTF